MNQGTSEITPELLAQIEHLQGVLGGFTWGTHGGFRDWTPGIRAAGWYQIETLTHELAHIAQLSEADLSRVHANSYGFRLRNVWVKNNLYYEPLTTQAIERECEVFAMSYFLQTQVEPTLNRDAFLAECTEIAAYLPGLENIPEQPWQNWVVATIRTNMDRHSFEKVRTRFQRNWAAIQAARTLEEVS